MTAATTDDVVKLQLALECRRLTEANCHLKRELTTATTLINDLQQALLGRAGVGLVLLLQLLRRDLQPLLRDGLES